jgi:DNA end-binding protein Ku
MASRPSWRGQLRLALVSCPIRLTPVITWKDKIRFHKLNRETGNRLRQQMIDEETEMPVSGDDTVMGYEFEKGNYVTVEKDEIDELKIESSETIKIEKVVPTSAVDWLDWDTPYMVEPDGKTGLDIFATIREALGDKDVVGIGRMVMSRRERSVLIQPRGKGMMIVMLRDPDEVKNPEELFDDIKDVKIDKDALSMAETLLDRMEGDFDLSMFEDRYQDALRDLVESKMKGKKYVAAEEPERPSNVVNLFDALKASLDKDGKPSGRRTQPAHARRSSKKAAPKSTKKTAHKATAQRTRKRA